MIIEQVYKPVIWILWDKKYEQVSKYLWKALENYKGWKYWDSIMNCSSVIQTFLQLMVNGKVWSWDISKLYAEAIKKDLIKTDAFSKEISDKFHKLLAKERKDKTDAHVELEEATEKDALYILNITLIHLQYWII